MYVSLKYDVVLSLSYLTVLVIFVFVYSGLACFTFFLDKKGVKFVICNL